MFYKGEHCMAKTGAQIGLRLTKELKGQLEIQARKERRSVSNLIIKVLGDYLDQLQETPDTPSFHYKTEGGAYMAKTETQITIRITNEMKEQLEKQAGKERRSVANIVRNLIEDYLIAQNEQP